jgi:arsenate reductase-like glutaredoxin family protein
MFEDTQTSEPMDTDDIDLFADDDMDFPDDQTSEAGEEVVEEQQENPVVEPQQTEQVVEETSFLDIVYNGQPMHLTKEQAITLAQKGQNYDKKVQELEALKNSPERQIFARMAQQSGMTVDQLISSVEDNLRQSTIQVRAEQLMRNEYMDQTTAMRVAQAEIEKEELLNQRNAEVQQRNQAQQELIQRQQAEQQKQVQFNNEFAELLRENPDFAKKYPTFDSLPKVMQEAVRNGSGIKGAYQQVQIEELRNEVAAYKQNEKNKSMSPGSVSGVGTKAIDPFEAALFGDD